MIYNFYTYSFLGIIATAAALSVLVRTLVSAESGKVWDISSVRFLILLIFSVISFSVALIFLEKGRFNPTQAVLFYSALILAFVALFYFLRVFALPVILLGLLSFSFLYYHCLEEYHPLEENNNFKIYVLQDSGESLSLEIRDFDNLTRFITYEGDNIYPHFTIVQFPDFLFFLQSSLYVKYDGLVNDSLEFPVLLNEAYKLSRASILPFAELLTYEPVPVGRDVLSLFVVELNTNGLFVFNRGN
jgi:hypothetical protein